MQKKPPYPEPPLVPVSRPGDLWLCAGHRILCGDATCAADVARLLEAAAPLLMVTDPPYGVEYDPEWREQAGLGQPRQTGTVPNDDRVDWSAAYRLFPGDVLYVWARRKQTIRGAPIHAVMGEDRSGLARLRLVRPVRAIPDRTQPRRARRFAHEQRREAPAGGSPDIPSTGGIPAENPVAGAKPQVAGLETGTSGTKVWGLLLHPGWTEHKSRSNLGRSKARERGVESEFVKLADLQGQQLLIPGGPVDRPVHQQAKSFRLSGS